MEIKPLYSDNANYTRKERALSAIKYIVIHYTGNRGDTALANARYFAVNEVGASAHYFTDENEVWHSVPDSHAAWHCGCKTGYHHPARNDTSLGVEICMLDKSGGIRWGAINKALTLTKELCAKYGVAIDHVCRHYDVTHKQCPLPFVLDERLWKAYILALHEGVAIQRAYLMVAAGLSAETVQYLASYQYGVSLLDKLCNGVYGKIGSIVRIGLAEETMQYMLKYEYAPQLIYKLGKAMV